jgi:hypothetical protein
MKVFWFFLQHAFMMFQVRRQKKFGVTMGEMTRYMDVLIKESEQLAMMIDSVPSVDNLDLSWRVMHLAILFCISCRDMRVCL